jgi:hypothetical protein
MLIGCIRLFPLPVSIGVPAWDSRLSGFDGVVNSSLNLQAMLFESFCK